MKFGSTGRFAAVAFTAAAFSVAAYAQDPAGTTGQRADADRDRDQVVTVTGCIMQEQNVPGRDANLFQRWGLQQQDYVLTNVQPQDAARTGQPGQVGQPGQAGQPGQQPTTTPGTADRPDHTGAHAALHADNMLKIEGKDADDLRQYANQRVEVRGKLDDHSWYERARGRDHDRDRTPGTAAAGRPDTDRPGTAGTPTGTAGTGVGTTGARADAGDRLTSIEVESIRAIGPCPQQPQQQQQ